MIEKLGKVTFFDTFLGQRSFHFGREGEQYEKWVADSETFLVGENVVDKDAIKFINSVTFSFEEIYEWVGCVSGIKLEAPYEPPPDQEFKLGEKDKLLSVHILVSRRMTYRPRSELRIAENAILSLSKKNKEALYGELEDAIEDIYSLRDLFSLLVGHKLDIENIRLSVSDQIYSYQYFIKGDTAKDGVKNEFRMFSELRDIGSDKFEKILKKWFELKANNDYILREFLSTQSRGDNVANFLSYSRFLEAFHRNICADKPLDNKLVENINEKIEGLVELEVPRFVEKEASQVKKKYSDSMISVNSYTLQERLERLLCNYIPSDIKASLDINESFAVRVKKIRNDLTHLNKNVRDIDRRDVSNVSEKLKVVAYVVVFKSIGLTDEFLSKKLRGIWRHFLV